MIIVFILLFYLEYTRDVVLWKYKFREFPIELLKTQCGDYIVDVGEYFADGKPSLSANNSQKQIKLSDWFSGGVPKGDNKQTKLTFFKSSKNRLAIFMKDWIHSNIDWFPWKFRDRYLSEHCEHTIRISRGKWEYPSHFDAIDIFTFVLCGNRSVILNDKQRIDLNPCDILYFDSGIYHHFWCDNDFSIVLNISFAPKNPEIIEIFNTFYPNRKKEIDAKKEYIF